MAEEKAAAAALAAENGEEVAEEEVVYDTEVMSKEFKFNSIMQKGFKDIFCGSCHSFAINIKN